MTIKQGHDRLGRFHVISPSKKSEHLACASCGMQGGPVVRFVETIQVDDKVRNAPSFIGRGRRTFGVTCGCYGRLQRQVVHIEENTGVMA